MTDGKYGSYNYLNGNEFFSPVFVKKTVDTTGCGDAYFAITSYYIIVVLKRDYFLYRKCLCSMHSQFYGNEKITNRDKLWKYLKSIINF